MIKVLLLTHGNLARSFYETLSQFLGDCIDVEFFCLDEDIHSFQKQVWASVIDSPVEDILVMTDLFGGTPFNTVAALLPTARTRGKRVEIITGINLPMLLDVVPNIASYSLKELKDTAYEIGRYGIRDLVAELEAKKGGSLSGSGTLPC